MKQGRTAKAVEGIYFILKKGGGTYYSNYRGISVLPTAYNIISQQSSLKVNSKRRRLCRESSAWVSTKYSLHSSDIGEEMGVHKLFINFSKVHDSIRR
jgi:hypothetical protein